MRITLDWTNFGNTLNAMQRTREQLHEQLAAMGSEGRYSDSFRQERAAVLHDRALADAQAQVERFGLWLDRLRAPEPTEWTAEEWSARTYHRQEWDKRLSGVGYDRAMELLEQVALDGNRAEQVEVWAAFAQHTPEDAVDAEVQQRARLGQRGRDQGPLPRPHHQLEARLLPQPEYERPRYVAARKAVGEVHGLLQERAPGLIRATTEHAVARPDMSLTLSIEVARAQVEEAAAQVEAAAELRAAHAAA